MVNLSFSISHSTFNISSSTLLLLSGLSDNLYEKIMLRVLSERPLSEILDVRNQELQMMNGECIAKLSFNILHFSFNISLTLHLVR